MIKLLNFTIPDSVLAVPKSFPEVSYKITLSCFTGSTSATHLSDSDHSWIYKKLAPRAAKWRDIGRELGFKQEEMDNIQSNPMLLTQSPPQSWLSEMLSQWLQWAPGDGRGSTGFATRESLHAALLKANLGQLAQQFIRPVQ